MSEEKEEEKAAPVPRGSGGGDSEALRKLMAAAKLRPRDATTYTWSKVDEISAVRVSGARAARRRDAPIVKPHRLRSRFRACRMIRGRALKYQHALVNTSQWADETEELSKPRNEQH